MKILVLKVRSAIENMYMKNVKDTLLFRKNLTFIMHGISQPYIYVRSF